MYINSRGEPMFSGQAKLGKPYVGKNWKRNAIIPTKEELKSRIVNPSFVEQVMGYPIGWTDLKD